MNNQVAVLPDTSDHRFVLTGYVLFAVVFIGFFGWALFAPLESAAPAQGVVIVKNERKIIQHAEGGILRELTVRRGDRVGKNQLLAVLDSTQLQATLDVTVAQSLAVEAQIARLQAERAGTDSVNWPSSNRVVDMQRYRELIAEQEALFEKRRESLLGEVKILQRRVGQLERRIEGLKENRITQERLLVSFESELSSMTELLDSGFVDESRVRDLRRRVVELRGRVQQIGTDIQAAEIQLGETELQVLQRRMVFDAEVQNQLADLQATRVELEERLRVAQDRLSRSKIRAPSEGVVLEVSVTTEGSVIPASQPFITIVPDEDDLVVEAKINPIDRDRVGAGQLAEMQFSAFDTASLPKIYGELVSISPDALIDQSTGQSYYKAVLRLPNTERQKLGPRNLVPGMPVTVLIQTGERTLWAYLTSPITNAMSRAMIEK